MDTKQLILLKIAILIDDGEAVKLEIKNMYRHKKGEIKFIDSDQAHVVFQPPKTSATLALWSADKTFKNQKIKRLIGNFPSLQNLQQDNSQN